MFKSQAFDIGKDSKQSISGTADHSTEGWSSLGMIFVCLGWLFCCKYSSTQYGVLYNQLQVPVPGTVCEHASFEHKMSFKLQYCTESGFLLYLIDGVKVQCTG
jgi:hypothetical protein